MQAICPVCNGFTEMHAPCPLCRQEMLDGGRLLDYYGDYSSYRPIDDLKKTNGFPDLVSQQCLHVGFCSVCQVEQLIVFYEASDEEIYAMQDRLT